MAERPAPYGEFDLRGLSDEHRVEFWEAAERALAALIERYGPQEAWPSNSYGAESLAHLIRMRRSIVAGEPPSMLNDFERVVEFDGTMEDIENLWRDA